MNMQDAPTVDSYGPQPGELDKQLDEIIYHVSHDVRATIRAMNAVARWTREDLIKEYGSIVPVVSEHLELLESRTVRADQMMLDLRAYSRVGRMSEKPGTVRLKPLIEQVADDLDLHQAFDLQMDIQVHALRAPMNECALLFNALLSNAIKHHDQPTGTIHITSALVDNGMTITVQDDGPGVPEKFRESVFEMMRTLRPRDECEGSGLGLPIARKVAMLLGGAIHLEAADGHRGTKACMWLPQQSAILSTAA